MIPFGWHTWRTESGEAHRFKITLTLSALPHEGGIYIFVRRRFFFFLKPLYVGKAASLKGRLTGHERWPDAWWKYGATERHILRVGSEEARRRLEVDLIRGLNPRMNDMLLPRGETDAPNDRKLLRHWKQVNRFWSRKPRRST